MRIVVTAGTGADIDAFACIIAYSELLNLEGKKAIPVVNGGFTASVTDAVLKWGAKYETKNTDSENGGYVLVDASDPERVPEYLNLELMSEVYDHRHGHEDYWAEKLGNDSHIEMVGACATQIWEEFKKRGKSNEISDVSAKLLLAAIVSNTLNFKSPLTTQRDKDAYSELSEMTGLSEDWIEDYFSDQEKVLHKDFKKCLQADTIVFSTPTGEFVIGQIELWDAGQILENNKSEIDDAMSKHEPLPWIVNILNISKGFNYIYSKSERGKQAIEEKLGLKFEGDTATTDDLLMRKYIRKVLRES